MTEQKIDNEPSLTGRTNETNGPTARVPVAVDEIIAATTALSWAARWDIARRLLASGPATGLDDATARRLAVAGAATAVHHDFRTAGARWAPAALAAAEAIADPDHRWDLDLLELQHDYGSALTGPDGQPVFGPDGHDPARLTALAHRAEALMRSAPDVARAGWAAFYRGLIADNLIGDRDGAPAWFSQALEAADQAEDDYLGGEALRHLGDHDEEAGDLERARARWERSAERWARIGNMTGVLAQQLLLAQLALTEGRIAAGLAIATEVSRWAGALGLVMYQQHADTLLASHQDRG
jgi:tetratricopeptide (TPR) repeat protein